MVGILSDRVHDTVTVIGEKLSLNVILWDNFTEFVHYDVVVIGSSSVVEALETTQKSVAELKWFCFLSWLAFSVQTIFRLAIFQFEDLLHTQIGACLIGLLVIGFFVFRKQDRHRYLNSWPCIFQEDLESLVDWYLKLLQRHQKKLFPINNLTNADVFIYLYSALIILEIVKSSSIFNIIRSNNFKYVKYAYSCFFVSLMVGWVPCK